MPKGESFSGESTPLLSNSSSFEHETIGDHLKQPNSIDIDRSITCGDGTKTGKVEYEIFTASGKHVLDQPEEVSTGTTNTESLMHLLKCMIGTGVMGLPMAYKNGGLWMGLAVVSLMGVICTHCMHILVQSSNELSIRTKKTHLDYASVIENACDTRNDWMRNWSNSAKNLVNILLIVTQLGICCTYIVFVTDNIKQVLEQAGLVPIDSRIYVVIISVLLVPYVIVKQLKTLAPFSAFANVLNCIGFVLILVNLFQDLPDYTERPSVADIGTIPLFFAQALFAFEAIGMVLPLHMKMIDKPAFLGKAGVLNLGLTITIALYNAVGFYGFLKYGEDTQPSITLNLPNDEWLYLSVKIMFSVSVYITFALQFYVPMTILWPIIEHKAKATGRLLPTYAENVFRFLLVLLTCGLSALVPHLDLLIALIGAFAGTFLAIILPAVIELLTFQCSITVWIKNGFIIGIGLTGFATGTVTTIIEIIRTF
ncbi:proton-coupled amino acid transporter 2-like [Mercenaria mercenaria]|uniref:proton-coupled amino acid transporter 2-like n=1 Tax=Mercenaria mercenaria TaxID=6596 RepID=UPI00234EE0EB|nr:proton-coupled amino acid transporter 2-like [Mercenaria mercenaria]